MRFTGILAAAAMASASANFLDGFQGVKTLASTFPTLDIEYSPSLECGACIRSGNIFCQNSPQTKKRDSTCCSVSNATACVLDALVNKKLDCATTNRDYTNATFFYNDHFLEVG